MENKCSCDNCNKKVNLIGYKCKCNGTYCTLHRYPETHKCSFNYQSYGKNQLEHNLIKLETIKLDKI
jgi:predicted nucleic acid binding AN1-type Zn finger protein